MHEFLQMQIGLIQLLLPHFKKFSFLKHFLWMERGPRTKEKITWDKVFYSFKLHTFFIQWTPLSERTIAYKLSQCSSLKESPIIH